MVIRDRAGIPKTREPRFAYFSTGPKVTLVKASGFNAGAYGTAYGGAGGGGGGGASAGDGADVTITDAVQGTTYGGKLTLRQIAKGGAGGSASATFPATPGKGANGGNGADSSLTDAAKGTAKGGTLTLTQYVAAGAGGSGGIGGVGGAGYSSLSFFDDLNNPTGTSKFTGTSRVFGGDGGTGTAIGGKGGDATAEINISAVRTVDATARADAGRGGSGPAGAGGNGGDATAVADAQSTGFATDGTAEASSHAFAGTGEIDGLVDSKANAFTANGQLATAFAKGDGTAGTAIAKAGTTTVGLVTFTQATATAQVEGVTTAEARASASAVVTGFPAGTLESYSFATSQPNATAINNALNANAEVKAELGAALASVFAAGMQGAHYGVGGPGTRTQSSTVHFDIDSQTLSGDLILGLLDIDSAGIGFKNVNLKVEVEGVTKLDTSFITLAVATPFFDDTAVNLGEVDNLADLDVTVTFTWDADATGNRFGFRYLLGTTNDEIDITPPPKPPTPDMIPSSDRGASTNDDLTNVTQPSFTGKTEANAKVSLRSGTNVIGSGTADKGGVWSITASKALSEGTHLINVTATDGANNTSVPSDDLTVVIDTTGPISPTPDLDTGSDSGASGADDVTNDSTPTFFGVTEAGATVGVTVGASSLGQVVADNDGKWSITAAGKIADGVYNVTSTVTDRAGNVGKASAPLSITIDTVAPDAPTTPDMVAASDTGDSSNDDITRQQFPTFVGTAEANAVITLFDGATKVGSAMAAGDGAWSIKSDQLAHGEHVLTVTATDLAGNVSVASGALTIDVDRIPPVAPNNLDLAAASDSGDSDSDNVTNDDTPTLTGKTQVNSTVALFDGATQVGVAKAAANGTWSITASTLTDGKHSLTAKATDLAGNVGVASAVFEVVIDTIAPPAPSAPDLHAGSDSGASSGDDVTNDSTPTLTGSSEAGATVTLFEGGTVLGSTTADAGGLWSITLSALTDGAHALTATARDLAGNQSVKSGALNVTIDTIAPVAPSTPDLEAGSDTGASASDNITRQQFPTLVGTAEANALITLFDGATKVGSTTAGADGKWSVKSDQLAHGEHILTVTATDLAGNVSAASGALTVDVDRIAPVAPTTLDLIAASDTGDSSGDNVTSDNTPTLTGKTQVNTTVALFDGATQIGTAKAAANGNWSITAPTLADGKYSLTAKATDLAGNVSVASTALEVVIDTLAPAAPSTPDLHAGSDTGASAGDDLTNDTTPTLTGSSEAGATVTVFEGETLLGSTTADTGGLWSITLGALGEGAHALTAMARDLAGNQSVKSGALTVTIDTTAPAAPSVPDLLAGSDTGGSTTDDLTNDTTPSFAGKAEANALVTVFADGKAVGSAQADGAGDWTVTASALADGVRVITATARDQAGNESAASGGLNVTIDTTVSTPAAPDLGGAFDTGASNSDDITRNNQPTLTGSADANVEVTLFDGLTTITTVKTDAAGLWTFKLPTLGDGAHVITTQARDAAGNVSVASGALNLVVDTAVLAPSAPDLDAGSDTGSSSTDNRTNDNTPTVTGTAEANATVTVLEGTKVLGTTQADAGGKWSFTTGVLSDGNHALKSRATDLAGNISALSGGLSFDIDTKIVPTGRPDLVAAADTGASSIDNVTRITTPTFVGTAEALTTVAVFNNTTLLGTAKVNATGNWSFKTPALADGAYLIRSRVFDAAGNVSGFSDGVNVTIDATAPTTPTALDLPGSSDSGVSTSDNLTNVTTPTISGKAEAGSTITLFDGATAVGTGKATGLGNWAVKTSALADGARTLTARSTDLAGNNSALSSKLTITVDATPPATPTITTATLASLGGLADVGATVAVFDGVTKIGAVTTGAGGTWTLPFAFGPGPRNLTAQASDTAGNVSVASATMAFEFGTAGNDVLAGAAGPSLFVGGAGDDAFQIDDPGDVVFELLGEGNDTVRETLKNSYTTRGHL